MNFKLFLLLFFLFSILYGDESEYWQQSVDYKMKVVLIDSVQQLACNSEIIYTNNSPDTLNEIYIHLYPNAFQLGSVKQREYSNHFGRSSRASYFNDGLKNHESIIRIRDLIISKKDDVILKNYKINDTILRANLKKPLLSGESIRIVIDWNHFVGGMVERAGYVDGQYNMAQWYPKLAAYDENGWHAEPFHAEGEFYGEFGTFDVLFELPEKFIIGSSGIVISGDPGWEKVKVDTSVDFDDWFKKFEDNYTSPDKNTIRRVRFLADNVHDFAWVASPNFLYEHDNWNNIDFHILYNRSNADDWNNVVRKRSVRAMKWMSTKFGDYPYPQITNVDRIRSGGMEYPMLIMDGSDRESLIVHEIGHIWFYGILANNELDEAWLDEGFTSAQTRDYMINYYGPVGFDIDSDDWTDPYQRKYWRFTNKLDKDQWYSIRFITSEHNEPISRLSYQFKNHSSYYQNAYTKPSLMLNELKYILGDTLYYRSMQDYYGKWKLKHVTENSFIRSVERSTNKDLSWFFNPWLHDTKIMDYGIDSWNKRQNKDGSYDINLNIRCLGNREMPLLIKTELVDGTSETKWWNNHLSRRKDNISYQVDQKPIRVTIDPNVQTMDVDCRNNTTKTKRELIFNWPGMEYNPRDRILYKWLPSLFYNSIDGHVPGLKVERSYGIWEKQVVSINYAMKKDKLENENKIYWSYQNMYKPVHFLKNYKFWFWGFSQPGLDEFGFEVEKNWSRRYLQDPYHYTQLGFYYQPSVDTVRTNLYDAGKLAVSYFKYNVSFGSVEFDSEVSTSINPYSDWSFNRVTFSSSSKSSKAISPNNLFRKITGFTIKGVRGRFFAGKIWTNLKGVPNQEAYNVEGNSSSDMFRVSYLRGKDSFFGYSEINKRYHMPGEGNIRGFVNMNQRGAESASTISIEGYIINKNLGSDGYFLNRNLNIELSLFADAGIFYDQIGTRRLADIGGSVYFSTDLLEKKFSLKLNFPLILIINTESYKYDNNWSISFQRDF